MNKDKLKQYFHTQAGLARFLGCTQQQVSYWFKKGEISNDAACRRIIERTNGDITVEDLRPKLFNED